MKHIQEEPPAGARPAGLTELTHPAVDNPPQGRLGAHRRPRVGEDVSDWAEEFQAAAMLIPGSWRERAKKKLARQNIVVGSTPTESVAAIITALLDSYAVSYAKKVEHMRTRSGRKQQAVWNAKQEAKREAAARADAELDSLVDELFLTFGQEGCARPVKTTADSNSKMAPRRAHTSWGHVPQGLESVPTGGDPGIAIPPLLSPGVGIEDSVSDHLRIGSDSGESRS